MPEEIETGITEEITGSGDPGSPDEYLEDDEQLPLEYEEEDVRKELDNLNKLYGKHTEEVGTLRTENDRLRAEMDLMRVSQNPQQPYGYQGYPTQPGQPDAQPQAPTNPWDDIGVPQQLTKEQTIALANDVFNHRIKGIMDQNAMIASFFRINPDLDPNKTLPILETIIRKIDPNGILSPIDRIKSAGQDIRDNYSSCVIRGGVQQVQGSAPAVPANNSPKISSPPGGQTRAVVKKKPTAPKIETPEEWIATENNRRRGKK